MLISSVWRDAARLYFIGGLLVGGLLIGVAMATLNAILFAWWIPAVSMAWIGVVAVLLAALIDLGLLRVRLPQNARQVPERVQLAGPRYGALQFGVEMGTGLRTFMTSALPHAVAFAVVLSGGSLGAVAAGLGFALGRTLVPIGRAIPGNDPGWTTSFDRVAPIVRATLAAALLTGFVLLLISL